MTMTAKAANRHNRDAWECVNPRRPPRYLTLLLVKGFPSSVENRELKSKRPNRRYTRAPLLPLSFSLLLFHTRYLVPILRTRLVIFY